MMKEKWKLSRRQFLTGSAASIATVGMIRHADAMEVSLGNDSYNYIKRGEHRRRVFSCSPMTPHDNPVEVWVDPDPMTPGNPLTGEVGDHVTEISGITESVRSRGRISAAEAAAWLQLEDNDRLLKPLKRVGPRGSGKWQEISWQQATNEIAAKIQTSAPETIALLRGRDTSAGAWERFLHTLGSQTIVDMNGSGNRGKAWHAAWGQSASIPDLAHTHYILNFGTNFMVTHPYDAAEAMDGRVLSRARIVTFDPRCSKTAGLSDEWVPVKPGSDGAVALSMVRYLLEQGLDDAAAITKYSDLTVEGITREVSKYTWEYVEEVSGVPWETLRHIARGFAESGRGCIMTGSGTSSHANGFDTERALMLLPLVTGNIERKGGNCLPRSIDLAAIEPVVSIPDVSNPASHSSTFPLDVGKRYNVNVLFSYNANPGFNAPLASVWREALADESRVGLLVSISTFKNETAELADILLPETHWMERNEPVQSHGGLLPWIGLRQRAINPPGQVRELREILRDIVQALGDTGKAKYWQFRDTKEWLAQQLGGIPGLKKDGGWKLMAEHSGVWPVYGYLHPEMRRIVDEAGEEVVPEYGKPARFSFKSFPHWFAAVDAETSKNQLTLVVHASDYMSDDSSVNNKVVMEATLANWLHINKAMAEELRIEDGSLVRVSSNAGYLVTRAFLTQMVRPDVVAMHGEGGHWSIGGVANGKAGPKHDSPEISSDEDINHNLWWADMGVHPMDILAPVFDAKGGGGALATAVTLEAAHEGDEYGMVKVDTGKLLAIAEQGTHHE